jgi:hypothetical protein
LDRPDTPSSYSELVRQTRPPARPGPPTPEEELDSVLETYQERVAETERDKKLKSKPDPVGVLRAQMLNEFIPVFVELVEKYSANGITMHMDASDFLDGGREVRFEFTLGKSDAQLLGTVTTEAIAFHETRHSPDLRGDLVTGPMLRLRGLTAEIFRDFICQRLTLLVRTATPKR